MKDRDFTVPRDGTVTISTAAVQPNPAQGESVATTNREMIRAWAARHSATPATGEASASGPATINVTDGGVGIRFNFPGVSAFRPISWDEWFDHFERHDLVFVYEEEVADRAYALWVKRGRQDGHDREDWLEAERQLRAAPRARSDRYWFVHRRVDADE